MNRENINQLIKFVENDSTNYAEVDSLKLCKSRFLFTMSVFLENYDGCKTACCLAGSAAILSKRIDWEDKFTSNIQIEKIGMEFLGINEETADALFIPDKFIYEGETVTLENIRKKHALFLLKNLVVMTKATPANIRRLWRDAFESEGF